MVVLPNVHRLISTIPGLIQAGSVVQLGPWTPTRASMALMRPVWPLSRNRNRMPTATAGVITGR
jgi:hypothetical protein